MSKKGVNTFASILSLMQETRIKLIDGDNQDKKLATLLEKAKDSIKDDFSKIVVEIPKKKK